MSITTLSAREFNQDIGRAKRAAAEGPVIITDRGQPAFVLQAYSEWRQQTGSAPSVSIVDALADPESADIEFEPPRLGNLGFKAADLD